MPETKFPNHRAQLLNLLISRYNYSSYLELGVDKAETFRQIELVDKTGVDNASKFATHHMTTDDYFANCQRTFDLIFIDAFHLAEQVLIDFQNSLDHLNDGGCIVLHDCLPKRVRHQWRRWRRTRAWTGDVWKAMVQIRRYPHVDSFVLDTDWGLGIAFSRPNSNQLEMIPESDLTWDNYLAHRQRWLRIIPVDKLLDILP